MGIPFLRGGKADLAEDPVCHMKVDKARPPGGSYTYKELTYYFCGPGCKRAFEKEPDSYLTGQKKLDMDHH